MEIACPSCLPEGILLINQTLFFFFVLDVLFSSSRDFASIWGFAKPIIALWLYGPSAFPFSVWWAGPVLPIRTPLSSSPSPIPSIVQPQQCLYKPSTLSLALASPLPPLTSHQVSPRRAAPLTFPHQKQKMTCCPFVS